VEGAQKVMVYLRLFWEFFKTGLFSVGGGLATLPFLSRMGDKHGWFTQADLANMLAVSESTPGPIGVNMATYVGFTVGYDQGGILTALLGGFLATLALILPSVIIILIVAKVLAAFKENKIVARLFYAIRPAVTGMIASAALMMTKSAVLSKGGSFLKAFDIKAAILFAALLVFTQKVKLHPIFYILIAGLVGVIFSM
jgi:chromate transporter